MAALNELPAISILDPVLPREHPLCPACRQALREDQAAVRHLGNVIVQLDLAHLDVSTHPHLVITACRQIVIARDELAGHNSPA